MRNLNLVRINDQRHDFRNGIKFINGKKLN